jgi:hypothetical protein
VTGPVPLGLQLAREHEPTELCNPYHCEWHHVDEVDERKNGRESYLWCGECFHLYRTPGELRRAYRRVVREMERDAPMFGDEYKRGKLRAWWQMLTIRAKKIHFCQYCTHDF